MKNKVVACILLFWQFSSHAQNIQNISLSPAFPGPTDSVRVNVDLVFTSGSCDLQFENHSVSNDTILINLYHCPGALTVICNTTDSINLGILAPGTYFTEVVVYTSSWSSPDPCSEFNPTDSGEIQLTVLPGSGIQENSSGQSHIYFDSNNKDIVLEGNYNSVQQIMLFNSMGQIVIKGNFDHSKRIHVPELSKGIYLYQLKSNNDKMVTGKILVND